MRAVRNFGVRVPPAVLVSTAEDRWLIANVYHRPTRRFYVEVFRLLAEERWALQHSYAATDSESSRKWTAALAGAHREDVAIPSLPPPVEPSDLRSFPRYRNPVSAAGTNATRLLPAWLALRIIGASIRREQLRQARSATN